VARCAWAKAHHIATHALQRLLASRLHTGTRVSGQAYYPNKNLSNAAEEEGGTPVVVFACGMFKLTFSGHLGRCAQAHVMPVLVAKRHVCEQV